MYSENMNYYDRMNEDFHLTKYLYKKKSEIYNLCILSGWMIFSTMLMINLILFLHIMYTKCILLA